MVGSSLRGVGSRASEGKWAPNSGWVEHPRAGRYGALRPRLRRAGAAVRSGRHGLPRPRHDRGRRADRHSSPPGAKERAILARLLLEPGAPCPSTSCSRPRWEGVPREAAARSLAVRVANLRSYLEPGRDRGAPSSLLVRDGLGYRLAIEPEQVDAHRFERCVHAAGGLRARRGAGGVRRRAGAVARHAVRRPRRRGVGAGRDPPARGPAQPRRGGPRPRARRARAPARGGRRRCAGWSTPTRCARSSSRTLMLALYGAGPPGRGARGLPRPGGAAARARAHAGRGARARWSAASSSTTPTLARRGPAARRRCAGRTAAAPARAGRPGAAARAPARGAGRARSRDGAPA